MVITKEFLMRYRTKNGGWTKKQLKTIGVSWPPPKNWFSLVVGNEINTHKSTVFQIQGMNSKRGEQCTTIGLPENKLKNLKKKKKKKDNFYASKEWRRLRYEALKLHGRQCLCCGGKPPNVELHVDHIRPRSKYPHLELDIDNLQILCKDCNLGKSNRDCEDYREGEVEKALDLKLLKTSPLDVPKINREDIL